MGPIASDLRGRSGSKTVQDEPAPTALLLFDVAHDSFALPLSDVETITPMARLIQSTAAPPLLAGFLNLAGEAIPVVRLSRIFGCPDVSPGLYTPLLILRSRPRRLALWVERVTGIVAPADINWLPVPENTSFNNCVERLAGWGRHVAIVLSASRLLLEKESRIVSELAAAEQRRLHQLEATSP